ncbi:unnamed protein product [Brachionus calyciflorus]|uniref:RING-type domain-containing protein n=1 Tax=Brachionus calyciflorus TaxID=104777 RepID=A0A813NAT1_9BILA|nr:unnamed protein product [Brachionus calyciflorus]
MDAETNFSNCAQCKLIFNSPRTLPCGEIVCQNCITIKTKSNKYKCFFCNDNHRIPKNGFPINRYAEKLVKHNLTKSSMFDRFTNQIKNIEEEIDNSNINENFAKQEINTYCSDLKLKIDLAIEEHFKLINDKREDYFKQIDQFESDCINNLESDKQPLIDFQTEVENTKKLLENEKVSNDDLRDRINRVKSIEWKVQAKKTNLKKFLLKNFDFKFYLNENADLFRLKKVSQSKINLNQYTRVLFTDLFEFTPRHCVRLNRFENGNFVFSYVDKKIKNYVLEIRSYPQIQTVLNTHSISLMSPHSYNEILTYKNKILVYESTKIKGLSKRLFIFDENLNSVKAKAVVFEVLFFAASENKIIGLADTEDRCYILDWDLNIHTIIEPNFTLFSFNRSINYIYGVEDYFFFCESNRTNMYDQDGRLIKSLDIQEPSYVDSNNIIKRTGPNELKVFNLNGNLIDNVELVNRYLSNCSFLKDKYENFVFYNDKELYVPLN